MKPLLDGPNELPGDCEGADDEPPEYPLLPTLSPPPPLRFSIGRVGGEGHSISTPFRTMRRQSASSGETSAPGLSFPCE